jgi:hypothetical protein
VAFLDTSSERAAEIIGEDLAGVRPVEQSTREVLRQLRGRIDRWLATNPASLETWRSILESPGGRRSQLADLLERVVEQDLVARHLIARLAPTPLPQPTTIRYQDFIVAIGDSGGGDGLSAKLLATPCGERCETALAPSFPGRDPQALFRAIESRIRGGRDSRPRCPVKDEALCSLEEAGRALFEALFVGRLRDAWIATMGLLAGRPDLGVRLRLVFDLRREGQRCVAALPWELLRDPATDQALCKNIRTPVVRSLESFGAAVDPPVSPVRSILLVESQPKDEPKLDIGSEIRSIVESWRSVLGVRVETIGADLDNLRDHLRRSRPEVLHFMGHGDFDPRSQEGMLVFVDATGRSIEISAERLSEQLSGIPLRLVALSSCRSGELPRTAGIEPFSGVASALVRSGSTAVLAMQFPVSDVAAKIFGRELYRRLAVGDSVESAVTEGRLAISRCQDRSAEWVTPVLYLRTDGLRLR